jgi:hypothetical protein
MGQFDFVRMSLTPKFRPPGEALQASLTGEEPEQGKVSIGGTGGGVIDLNYSMSTNINRNHADEDRRIYDKVRVIASNPDGTLDPNHYVEIEVVRQLSFGNGDKVAYARPELSDNIKLMQEGLSRKNPK